MKAVSIDKPRTISIINVTQGEVGEDEALVKIKAAGVCGSDLGSFLGTFLLVTYPRIPGHEIAGEVVEVCKNDRNIAIGDKVTLEPLVRCERCYPCRIGRYNCCENLQVLGVHLDGGMREYFRVPVNLLHKLPDDMDMHVGALVEPLTIGMQAVNRSMLCEGETALILGAGPIGLMTLAVAKSRNAKVISVDLIASRLEKAEELGADYAINPTSVSLHEAVKEITNGEMANVVFEAVGAAATIESTIYLVSYAGRIVIVGHGHEPVEFKEPHLITKKELDIRGSRNSRNTFPDAIKFIQSCDVRTLITHIFPYTKIQRAFSILETKSEPVTKILLTF